MASYEEASITLSGYEGGYVNDPDDYGKETYRGVSRRYHPTWVGWEVIDEIKDAGAGFEARLDTDKKLQRLVKEFYKVKFWDRFWGDQCPSQAVATELLDIAANLGAGRAIGFLQKSLNALNRDGRLWTNLVVDRRFGTRTQVALKECLVRDEEYLLIMLNVEQGSHYIHQVKKRSRQNRFLRGWLGRVTISKDYQQLS
jgi:lysozyme family protein